VPRQLYNGDDQAAEVVAETEDQQAGVKSSGADRRT